MDAHIRFAAPADVDGILELMETVARGMEHPERYVTDDRDFVEGHIDREGFTLLWMEEDQPAGFLIVRLPGDAPDNLGRDLGLPRDRLDTVAHMESASVLPRYRGRGIQGKLVAAAEEEVRTRGCRHAMGTVHPANAPSLTTMTSLGYEIVATKKKYGGQTRHILHKDLL